MRIYLLSTVIFFSAISVAAQEPSAPVVVQPGSPGQPSKRLAAGTKAVLPPQSAKNVEFMQGMIMHHAQAVEMTALIASRTNNKDLALLGERISKSQTDEMLFMKRWLELRGSPVETAPKANDDPHGHSAASILMPGMLSPRQMEALRNAKGSDFDRLFLEGMIQHHKGALEMVKDLFATPGAGQDAELFNFAADVDTGQRAEIRSMQTLLEKKT